MATFHDFFMLKGTQAVPVDEFTLQPIEERRVARDEVGDRTVSTVFLGINHGLVDGPPVLFETMVFGPEGEEHCQRYSTWEEAAAGHAAVVAAGGEPR